ncbi:LysR family transcriptional regulator [Phenylobacterium sp.]|uniref:LysR family transcriptional regulator n=1 Tax=Phenylobacterium sp. TaxID=1871053 RepID=UPI0025FD0DD6|nr:LysR family transcriptional regulator [Phenylobacterium sp.]MBX3482835.1 LysR family transcriptional regulator [Phenylobacterium sp.]MCW5759409.1 LysR family transcriptional regulator [Phenylobacterium sp.]
MTSPDLNLLIALDVLLAEGSVAGAARRLRLSPSAMSRTLARLRDVTGDPLLARAGRGLVATPRGEALRDQAHQLVEEAQALLRPAGRHDPETLARTFTLRTSDGFVENFGPRLLARVAAEAPNVRLNFLQKPDKESAPLREGRVDLETGVIEPRTGPELRSQALFRDRLVGAVRAGHPLAGGEVTAERYAAAGHVIVSRTGHDDDAVDRPFLPAGFARRVVVAVGGFAPALALARTADLVATVPERHTAALREGMVGFPLPMPTGGFAVSMLWSPRLDADPAHRWFRGCVREVCV